MKIAINLITFRRPDGLRRLLEGITALTFTGPAPELTVIVVDNDAAGSARAVAEEFSTRLPLTYVIEPEQGIPFARNRALNSTPPDADYVALIDDDEVPSPVWLDELIKIQAQTQADFVRGPVLAYFPEGAPEWIEKGRFFDRPAFADGHVLIQGASNNALLSFPAIQKHKLRFSEALRFTGGSDHLFFLEAHRAGLKTVWSSKGFVTEWNPASRATYKWLLRRQYRLGNTLSLGDRMMSKSVKKRFLRLVKAGGRALIGLGQMALVVKEGRIALARGMFSLARAAGMVVGLFGGKVEEYHPTRL